MNLKALSSFRYGNRILAVGDPFEANDKLATVLIAIGRATINIDDIKKETPKKATKKRTKDT